jgi:hypothetical protein
MINSAKCMMKNHIRAGLMYTPWAETYKLLLGYYPELIQADKIYAKTGSGVKKEIFGLQLHQKDVLLKKQQLKYEKKRKNMHKLKETSSTWIAVTIFVMNLSRR